MSAFLVSEKHVMTLAMGYSKHCQERRSLTQGELEHVAKTLWKENNKSVNYRYAKRRRLPEFTGAYPTGDKASLELFQLYALIRCYEYQACEHPTYEKSKAAKIMRELSAAVAHTIISGLPAYDKTQWGI